MRRPKALRKDQELNARYCEAGELDELYKGIKRDLAPWKQEGITADLMDWVLQEFPGYPLQGKGAAVSFQGGQPFIISDLAIYHQPSIAHHQRLIAGHLALVQALSETFGSAIPDVDFVMSTIDGPTVPLARYGKGTTPPVLRFCKSKSFADILVPDIHFQLRGFTAQLLDVASNFTATWPWDKKQPVLFGRFSPYARMVDELSPEVYRKGKNGTNICNRPGFGPGKLACDVRRHFMSAWARGAAYVGLPVDVAQQPKKDMMYHASNKWLLHLDGQSCSSRLEQLMALGSTVVKEESGYFAFFHHLLQPYKHYVPFWRELPEEAKQAIEWATAHDREAQDMAAAAQDLAQRYLHKRALMCYWFTLLKEMGGLMRYRPGAAAAQRNYTHWHPVSAFMKELGVPELRKRRMWPMEFW